MIPPNSFAPLVHGGNLDAARRLFPEAPEPWLDLSTGINPHPYPIPEVWPEDFARLPDAESLKLLTRHAAIAYAAPSETNVVPAPGSQILTTLIAGLVPPGRAAILGPTYAEHARVAALAGHDVSTAKELAPLGEADLAIVVNPNNPDGRIFGKHELLRIAEQQRDRGGLLVVDEAFMDAGPRGESLSLHVEQANVVVLRSFGKFFGLAGLRLSFALAAAETAARLRASLGPWPVSGPALAIGKAALWDGEWIEATRLSLGHAAVRLKTLLQHAGLESVGYTDLFHLVRSPNAPQIFERLGRAGILVRRFEEEPEWLRFGLPGEEEAWQRLETALRA
ncbi:MAG TPA: threonine-phosphate decarboxylase CobD [Methyloceanibacter sp.]|nr:threonine-phosphate decarboxylase CobD [Methyloceanibacter sp.]